MALPLLALFKKVLILKRRAWFVTLVEFALVVAFFWGVGIIPLLDIPSTDKWVKPTVDLDTFQLTEMGFFSKSYKRIAIIPSKHSFWNNIADDWKDVFNKNLFLLETYSEFKAMIRHNNIDYGIEIINVPSSWNMEPLYSSERLERLSVSPRDVYDNNTNTNTIQNNNSNNYQYTTQSISLLPSAFFDLYATDTGKTFSYIIYYDTDDEFEPSTSKHIVNIDNIVPSSFPRSRPYPSLVALVERRAMTLGGLYPNSTPLTRDTQLDITTYSMPTLGYLASPVYLLLIKVVVLSVVLIVSFSLPTIQLAASLVHEKELKMISLLRLMGMNSFGSILSWFIYYICFALITSTIGIALAAMQKNTVVVHSSAFLFWLFFICIQLSTLSFGIMISSFFSQRKTSLQIGFIIYIAISILGATLSQFRGDSVFDVFFFSSTFTSVFRAYTYLNANDMAFTTKYFYEYIPGGRSIAQCFGCFIVQIIMYLFSATYLQVVLGSDGTSGLPVYFLCVPRYWPCSSRKGAQRPASQFGAGDELKPLAPEYSIFDGDNTMKSTQNIFIQQASHVEEENIGLSLSNVTLEYNQSLSLLSLHKCTSNKNTIRAIDDLSLDIYKGQISVLLGKNGAGKSSLTNILCGVQHATYGNITRYIDNCTIGICPQYNALYPNMTVYEHMKLFSSIKLEAQGRPTMDTYMENIEIDHILDLVGLNRDGKCDEYTSTLSGGQKRKLCLAIALLHNNNNNTTNNNNNNNNNNASINTTTSSETHGNNILILDEPSSGMDISAQRELWELLKILKKDRIILLTTHSLEEAEIADRISIIADGKLLCNGSPLYLKHKYGIGYTLHFQKKKNDDYDQLVHSNGNNSVNNTDNNPRNNDDNGNPGGQLDTLYHITTHSGRNIIDILNNSEYKSIYQPLHDTQYNITFQIPFTSSSQIGPFLRYIDNNIDNLHIEHYTLSVTTLSDVFMMANAHNDTISEGSNSNTPSPILLSDATHSIWNTERKRSRFEIFSIQLYIFLYKRILISLYSIRFWLESYIVPILLAVLLLWIVAPIDFKLLSISPSSIHDSTITYNISGQSIDTDQFSKLYSQQFDINNNNKHIETSITDYDPNDMPLYLNSTYTTQGNKKHPRIISLYPYHVNNMDTLSPEIKTHIYLNTTQPISHGSSITAIHQTIIDTVSNHNVNGFTPFDIKSYFMPFSHGFVPDFDRPNVASSSFSHDNNNIYNAINIKHDMIEQFMTRYPSLSSLLSPSTLDMLAQAALSTTRPTTTKMSTTAEDGDHIPDITTTIAIWIFMIALPIILIPISLSSAYTITHERSIHVEHLQFISGTNALAFWLSHFIFDMCILLSSVSLIIASICITQLDPGIPIASCITTMIIYGIIVFPFSYCATFLFSNPSYVHLVLSLLHFPLPACIAAIIMATIASPSSSSFSKLIIFPVPWAAVVGYCSLYDDSDLKEDFLPSNTYKYAIGSLCLWLGILVILEANRIYGFISKLLRAKQPFMKIPNNVESQDVIAERQAIKNGQYDSADNYPLVVDGLRRTYGKYTAVNNSHIVFPKGTITSIIGPNGCGKSTTISMITADFLPSSSSGNHTHTARITGYDIINQPYKAWKHIGYCPQHDALNLELTGRQQLRIYSYLRGVTGRDCDRFIEHLLETLGLTYAADRSIETYSLGMRRRLSIGVSLIGNPDVVVLDECTTGVDPISKQRVYDLIKKTMSQRTVLLTSHAMEEIEAISDRVAIMKDGLVIAMGTKQHLKNTYGNYYSVHIDCHINKAPSEVVVHIANALKDKIEFNPQTLQAVNINQFKIIEILDRSFVIGISKDIYNQADLFDIFTSLSQQISYGIATYSISQIELGQVFLSLHNNTLITNEDRYIA